MTLIFTLALLWMPNPSPSTDTTIFYKGDVNAALAQAETSGKLLLVDIYTTWCGPCKRMDRVTFQDKAVKQALKDRVVAFKIDAEKGEGINFATKYRISSYPSFLILNAKGEVVERKIGYMPPKQFMKWLDSALN